MSKLHIVKNNRYFNFIQITEASSVLVSYEVHQRWHRLLLLEDQGMY